MDSIDTLENKIYFLKFLKDSYKKRPVQRHDITMNILNSNNLLAKDIIIGTIMLKTYNTS